MFRDSKINLSPYPKLDTCFNDDLLKQYPKNELLHPYGNRELGLNTDFKTDKFAEIYNNFNATGLKVDLIGNIHDPLGNHIGRINDRLGSVSNPLGSPNSLW